ncbi:MAG TPA: hypothetical protein VHS97_11240 [Isosphaeraceae bacterium]|nr:hypothetical protein [Isosphaeraceae bacterium]
MNCTILLGLVVVVTLAADDPAAPALPIEPPEQVEVLPVFVVPRGEASPTTEQTRRLVEHVKLCQNRYEAMLGRRDTFRRAEGPMRVHRSGSTLAELRRLPEDSAPAIVGALLTESKLNRFNCPYVFLAVVINPGSDWPVGGGRPLNGGFNTGGGIVVLSSRGLDRSPNFQSTLQHELGHGFGLPHVDVYGYDMKTNPSVMSYNLAHHTQGFRPSPTPGRLIAEDIRGLALNRRAFPKLTFDPNRDAARSSRLEKLGWLGPMTIPGQPAYAPKLTTPSGEDFGTAVGNVVAGRVESSAPPPAGAGGTAFNAKTMWQSKPSPDGWVTVEAAFPFEVTLTGVAVHSQHSGRYHAADRLRVETPVARGDHPLAEFSLTSVDQQVALSPTTTRTWRFRVHAANGRVVVLRGLRFFSSRGEIVPPLVPYGS